MEPIKPAATLPSKNGDQHEPADGGDAASGAIGGLPFHLTEEILRRISPLESVRFAAVCKSWAATVSERPARPAPHLLALELLPGPACSPRSSRQRRRGAIFSLPTDQEESPATPARLPAAFGHATDVELSGALPFGDFSFVDHNRLAAYADGIFYAMDYNGFTYIVDRRGPLPWGLKRLRAPSILKQYSWIPGYTNNHLLVSEGEAMFVGLVLAPQEPACPTSIGGFEVYRLDVEVARWVKVERLADDRALFVSEQSSFAVRASETPVCRC